MARLVLQQLGQGHHRLRCGAPIHPDSLGLALKPQLLSLNIHLHPLGRLPPVRHTGGFLRVRNAMHWLMSRLLQTGCFEQ